MITKERLTNLIGGYVSLSEDEIVFISNHWEKADAGFAQILSDVVAQPFDGFSILNEAHLEHLDEAKSLDDELDLIDSLLSKTLPRIFQSRVVVEGQAFDPGMRASITDEIFELADELGINESVSPTGMRELLSGVSDYFINAEAMVDTIAFGANAEKTKTEIDDLKRFAKNLAEKSDRFSEHDIELYRVAKATNTQHARMAVAWETNETHISFVVNSMDGSI